MIDDKDKVGIFNGSQFVPWRMSLLDDEGLAECIVHCTDKRGTTRASSTQDAMCRRANRMILAREIPVIHVGEKCTSEIAVCTGVPYIFA